MGMLLKWISGSPEALHMSHVHWFILWLRITRTIMQPNRISKTTQDKTLLAQMGKQTTDSEGRWLSSWTELAQGWDGTSSWLWGQVSLLMCLCLNFSSKTAMLLKCHTEQGASWLTCNTPKTVGYIKNLYLLWSVPWSVPFSNTYWLLVCSLWFLLDSQPG